MSKQHRKASQRKRQPRKTTALVRRQPIALAPVENGQTLVLSDAPIIGALGITEIQFTDKEEGILARAVRPEDVRVKPSGQAYLSHPSYTRWFNEAFGRGGWNIVPCAKPMQTPQGVACPYVLYIHGKPAAFALGEQDLHEGNREQTYGDAIEATVASALRRCAKRLGVGLELWDKVWLDEYMRQHAVRVTVTKDGRQAVQWRRKDDRPFWNETGRAVAEEEGGRVQPAQRREAPAAYSSSRGGDVISEKQLNRLWAMAKQFGWSKDQIHAMVDKILKLDSTGKIKRLDYDKVCGRIEQGPGEEYQYV